MKYFKVFLVVVFASLAFSPVLGQDGSSEDCDPAAVASEFSSRLEGAKSLQELQLISNELSLAISSCNAASQDVGKSRSNPIAPGQRRQIDDEYAITVDGYRDITELLAGETSNEAPEGQRYLVVWFQYHCTLSVDEMCSDGLHVLEAVGNSGIVYEYESLFGIGLDFSWDVFGGGTKEVFTIFLVDEADVEDLLVFAGEQYNDTIAFFDLGELITVEG